MEISKVKRPSESVLVKIHQLKEQKGKIAVIDPETGDYFIGRSLTEALAKGKKKYPHKVFYSIRIGSSFVHEHKGGIRKL